MLPCLRQCPPKTMKFDEVFIGKLCLFTYLTEMALGNWPFDVVNQELSCEKWRYERTACKTIFTFTFALLLELVLLVDDQKTEKIFITTET